MSKPAKLHSVKMIRSYGFKKAAKGDGRGATCDDCQKRVGGHLGWWRKTSYEYDEWECLCRRCASDYVENYESFNEADFDAMLADQGATL